jgi:3-oxoacyl-[acyl-carrier protein] reductase/bacilysin biosynthesis oxidoreductase BacG
MELGLSGKKILITGGSRGIGRACAEALSAEGAVVAMVGRGERQLQEATERIRTLTGGEVYPLSADLSTLDGVRGAVEMACNVLGRIDVLINNAGSIRAGAFVEIPDEQWLEDWNLKLFGYVRAAREVFPLMRAQGGGTIVNIVGTGARQVVPSYLVGGAANAALINFTKGLSDLGATHNIRVKAVSPGAVETERWHKRIQLEAEATGRTYEELRDARLKEQPLGRIVTAQEVADLVCFLVSPRADAINGISVTIDGGWSRGVYP